MPPLCSASEINLLVYHYLKESGLYHSCFALRHESRLDDEPLSREAIIEPGQLVRVLQKGLLFLAVEAHVNEDGSEKPCSAPFRLIGPPHVCDGVPRPQVAKRPRRLTPSPSPSPAPGLLTIAGPAADASSASASKRATPAPSGPNGSHAPDDTGDSSTGGQSLEVPTVTSNKRKAASSPPARKDDKRVRRTGSDAEEETQQGAASSSKRRKENGNSTPPKKKGAGGGRAALHSDDEDDAHQPGLPNGRASVDRTATKDKTSKGSREERSASPQTTPMEVSDTSRSKAGSSRDANHKKKKKKGSGGSMVGSSSSRSGRDRGDDSSGGPAVPRVLQPPQPKRLSTEDGGSALGVADKEISFLAGHSAEVFLSAWNPAVPGQIASGAGDATVRIWDVPLASKSEAASAENEAKVGGSARIEASAVCKHLPLSDKRDVSALDWNPDGTLLASGSYDGILRLWTAQGDLYLVMPMHSGPIFGVQWNRTGSQILTGSADGTAIVWELSSGKVRQQFSLHSDSVLDVDWLTTSRIPASAFNASSKSGVNGASLTGGSSSITVPTLTSNHDAIFATCSADNSILILRVGEHKPIKALRGHDDEVNAVRFDASKALLASVSDDTTARLWSVDTILSGSGGVQASGTSKACLHTLRGHTRELYALQWAPTGPGSPNPDQPRMLATTSFDNTARLWNADDGTCLRTFTEHTDSVHTLCFSPDARFLATGAIDCKVLIRAMSTGRVLREYVGGGAVFDVVWHSTPASSSPTSTSSQGASKKRYSSHHLAVSQANRVLAILDVSELEEYADGELGNSGKSSAVDGASTATGLVGSAAQSGSATGSSGASNADTKSGASGGGR